MSSRRQSDVVIVKSAAKQRTGETERRKSESKVFRTEFNFNTAMPSDNEKEVVSKKDRRKSKDATKKKEKRKASHDDVTKPEVEIVENGSACSSKASTPRRGSVDSSGILLKPEVGLKPEVETSRAQRLRKSIIANSMSSLTPICE